MTDFVVIYLDLRTPEPVEAEFEIQAESTKEARERFNEIAVKMNWAFLSLYQDDTDDSNYERLGNTESDELGRIFY